MNVTVVTGFVPLNCAHRSAESYYALGAKLTACCKNVVCFHEPLEKCWLAQAMDKPPEQGGKDSDAYHCVQHQKTAWLKTVASFAPYDILVWIDYGIFHLADVCTERVIAFLNAVAARPPWCIMSPTCGPRATSDAEVNWTFCGGVLALPASQAGWFHDQCVLERAGKRPTWEVNTWNHVARRNPNRFAFWMANHDATMFTGYPTC